MSPVSLPRAPAHGNQAPLWLKSTGYGHEREEAEWFVGLGERQIWRGEGGKRQAIMNDLMCT